ncbi:MAG TPA: ABC transporter permease [Armatimonadota bacterium]|nr:ABC transporter permease [Armatimonadota bacterium]
MNWRRVLRIIKKEFLQLRRDPRLLRMVVVAPVLQLILFGYAVTTDVRHVSMAVYDEDHTPASRALVARFVHSGYFDLDRWVTRPDQIQPLLDASAVQVAVHIPRGFAKDLARGLPAAAQVILDGSDSTTAGIISGYVAGVAATYSGQIEVARIGRLAPLPRVESRLRVWYNPELKSVNFMVPAVLCMILLNTTMMLTCLAIVKEREIGTLEQLVVTPITARELMVGKTVPFIVISFVDVVLVLLVSSLWFRVPIAGSLMLLFALAALFLLTSLGSGLFISTISHTQQQAMMTAFFFMFPSFILSGLIFPIENMPRVIQWVTYAIPLRYFLTIVRGIFLKGSGLDVLWPHVVALAVFGLVIMMLSVARFTKRLG